MDRRRFLKYAGGGVVAGAATVGGAVYYLGGKPKILETVTTAGTTSVATSETSTTYSGPQITGLTHTPTRVVNDRVHDIRVDVEITDPAERLSYVVIALEPVSYGQFSAGAFLREDRRTVHLESSGSEKQTLSAVFTDLKGGREYDLNVGAADANGIVDEKTSRTEYIREFENLGRQLYDKGLAVIADYYTWWDSPGGRYASWGAAGTEHAHVYNPLLGEYSSADPIVVARHVDWATGYGVNTFAVSWHGSTSDSNYYRARITQNFESGLLKSQLLSQIGFCILYENNDRLKIQNPNDPAERWIEDLDDPYNREALVSDFVYLTKYFSNQQYLRIDGKPCVRFDYTTPFRGDIQGVFDEVRSNLRSAGWEVYLINDLAGRSDYPSDLVSGAPLRWRYPNISPAHISQVIESTDAFGGSGPPTLNNYNAWHDFAVKRGKDFLPVAWPGMEGSPFVYSGPLLKRSPELLRKTLNSSIEYGTRKMAEIVSFNEWTAGHQIEPAKEYGSTYLGVVRDCAGKP